MDKHILIWNKRRKRLISNLRYVFNLGNLPDFLILGAQKAGTTAIYQYIEQYASNFYSPISKELYFFTEKYDKGIRYYKSQFKNKKNSFITGESTPDYLFYHLAPKRIYDSLGENVKFIVILRDPVKRAFSQYNHQNFTNKTKAFDELSFSEAIRNEEQRFNSSTESSFFYEYKYYSYKARGKYIEQLYNWLKYYPRSSFLITTLNRLNSNPEFEMNEIFKFLGLKKKESFHQELFKVVNSGPKMFMKDVDKEYLKDYFEESNRKLFDEFGIEF